MENAILVGLSQQAALRRHMDIIANNLANISTAGFKAEKPVFQDYVMPLATIEGFTGEAAEIHYVQDASLVRDLSEGPMNHTGNTLDWAINGTGWFTVEGPDGELFTRNGHFHLDEGGQVVTSEGLPVLADNGPIVVATGETGLSVAADGTITTSAGAKGRLRIVQFEDEARLEKRASGLYSATPDQEPVPATGFHVVQGILEGSNVNAVKELTEMIAVTRAYTNAADVMQAADDLRQAAIRDLGQVPA